MGRGAPGASRMDALPCSDPCLPTLSPPSSEGSVRLGAASSERSQVYVVAFI